MFAKLANPFDQLKLSIRGKGTIRLGRGSKMKDIVTHVITPIDNRIAARQKMCRNLKTQLFSGKMKGRLSM